MFNVDLIPAYLGKTIMNKVCAFVLFKCKRMTHILTLKTEKNRQTINKDNTQMMMDL